MRPAIPLSERFFKQVLVIPFHSCWEWTGSKFRGGYGQINSGRTRGKTLKAHRVSYLLHYGLDPGDRMVCHTCDNPGCVRPEHLFLGTAKDNVLDMFNKNRQHKRSGSLNGQSKITESQAVAIRSEYSLGLKSQSELGFAYGISQSMIGRIVSGKAWKGC